MPPKNTRKRKAKVDEGTTEQAKARVMKTRKMSKAIDDTEHVQQPIDDDYDLEPEGGQDAARKALFAGAMKCNYWLMKSEPNQRFVKNVDVSFSIDALEAADGKTAEWDGVRNTEACSNMKCMNVGDIALFYHSNCRTPGVVGIVEIVRKAYPDQSQFEGLGPFFDRNSSIKNPKWFSVDVKFIRRFEKDIPLTALRRYQYRELSGMPLFDRPRLSVQPITKQHFDFILQLDLSNQQENVNKGEEV